MRAPSLECDSRCVFYGPGRDDRAVKNLSGAASGEEGGWGEVESNAQRLKACGDEAREELSVYVCVGGGGGVDGGHGCVQGFGRS